MIPIYSYPPPNIYGYLSTETEKISTSVSVTYRMPEELTNCNAFKMNKEKTNDNSRSD